MENNFDSNFEQNQTPQGGNLAKKALIFGVVSLALPLIVWIITAIVAGVMTTANVVGGFDPFNPGSFTAAWEGMIMIYVVDALAGVAGVVFGILGLMTATKAKKLGQASSTLTAGFILSIIGLCVASLMTLCSACGVCTFGALGSVF